MIEDLDPARATDDELMRRAQDNDVEAFEQLYDRYGTLAYRVARSVCRDQERAGDAVQDGFLSVWRNRSDYSPARGTFKSWSIDLVRHSAIDLNHRDDVADTLRESVGRLPDAQAEVIALAFYGELTHAEIAQRLALPQGTVKGRMRLGLEQLRQQMSA